MPLEDLTWPPISKNLRNPQLSLLELLEESVSSANIWTKTGSKKSSIFLSMKPTESWKKKVSNSWSEAFKKSEELPCSQQPSKLSTKKTFSFTAWETLPKFPSNKQEIQLPTPLLLPWTPQMMTKSTSFQRVSRTLI